MDEGFRHSVKLGNNTKMNVLGKGNVKLDINGVIHVIQDIFFVPDLKNNLEYWSTTGEGTNHHVSVRNVQHISSSQGVNSTNQYDFKQNVYIGC